MLLLCPYPLGVAPGQRLKYEQYFDDWRSNGWEIVVSPYMDMDMWKIVHQSGHFPAKVLGVLRGHLRRLRDLFRVQRYDVVYVFMWVTPLGTTVMERLVRYLARRLIYDIEDNILVGDNLPKPYTPNSLIRVLKGPGKAKYLIKTADHVIASSPFLRDSCSKLTDSQRCTYISSSVDTVLYEPVNPYCNDRKVTIGWSGSYSTLAYLDSLANVFQQLARRVDFRLRVIVNSDYELPGVDLEVIRWSPQNEVKGFQGIDIGVYPLPNDQWVIGKSGLKCIQYMAFGLPTVASDSGLTPQIIRHGENGLLVRSESEWLEALETLARDPLLRRKLGEAARKDVEKKYSIAVIRNHYRKVLESVVRETK